MGRGRHRSAVSRREARTDGQLWRVVALDLRRVADDRMRALGSFGPPHLQRLKKPAREITQCGERHRRARSAASLERISAGSGMNWATYVRTLVTLDE
eukprot:2119217-Pyramimonas_sp.AAC.1